MHAAQTHKLQEAASFKLINTDETHYEMSLSVVSLKQPLEIK